MGHYVYKYVYNNEIIYIGKNDTDLYSRLKQHGKQGDNIPNEGWDEINNSDIFYCELPNKVMSDVVESELIRRYKPKWNKSKKSEWCGINFVEPIWQRAFEKSKDEIIKEKDAIIKGKDQIIKEKDCEIFHLKSQLERCNKGKDKLRELERYKNDYFLLSARYDTLLSQINHSCVSDGNSYSFDDICNWYKQTELEVGIFAAITYDSKKNVTSYKKIYIDSFGRLYFEFEQIHRLPASGVVFWDKTDKTKKNWNVIRIWLNAGTNEYLKIA